MGTILTIGVVEETAAWQRVIQAAWLSRCMQPPLWEKSSNQVSLGSLQQNQTKHEQWFPKCSQVHTAKARAVETQCWGTDPMHLFRVWVQLLWLLCSCCCCLHSLPAAAERPQAAAGGHRNTWDTGTATACLWQAMAAAGDPRELHGTSCNC